MSYLLAAVLAVTLVGQSPTEKIFSEGETLVYTLSWLRFNGGVGRMTINPAGESYRITSLAESTPGFSKIYRFRDAIETTVARSDFSTLRYVKRLDEKGDTIEEVTTVEDGVATRTRNKTKQTPVPRPVFDPISVIYYLRTLDLTPGKRHQLTVIADGKVYSVDARVLHRETIATPAGRFATVVVEPLMVSGGAQREETLQIWYSDDSRHIPVRIRSRIAIGSITATLTQHSTSGTEEGARVGQ